MGTESQADPHALLELIGDVCGLLDIEELRQGLLTTLRRVLPSDYVSLNDVGPTPGDVVSTMDPPAPEFMDAWVRHAHQNPLLRNHLRTLDGRAYRFSDVIGCAELHRLALYREVYRPLGVEHQMAFTLPADEGHVLAIALSRGAHDYTDAERDLANEARPFLIQAYVNALAYSRLKAGASRAAAGLVGVLVREGLTTRQAQALRLVALGRSNQHIAAELGISDRTVGKHLEHAFRKLEVDNRSSAARRVWELTGEDTAADAAPAGVLAGA